MTKNRILLCLLAILLGGTAGGILGWVTYDNNKASGSGASGYSYGAEAAAESAAATSAAEFWN